MTEFMLIMPGLLPYLAPRYQIQTRLEREFEGFNCKKIFVSKQE
jgi:hypothetical protein